MEFYHYIYENELTSENIYLPINLGKKSQFHFSLFKADSQNHKLNLVYLTCNSIPKLASRWRICYQFGLPGLVLLLYLAQIEET